MLQRVIALSILLLAFPACAEDPGAVSGKPYISDGDTLSLPFRLFGIDTPEKLQLCEDGNGQCYRCGDAATRHLKQLASKSVTCSPTGGKTYGRIVAWCSNADGVNLNIAMVADGWAVAYRRFLESTVYEQPFLDAEADAKAGKRGIWQGHFIPPHRWRKGDRLGCER